MRARSIAFAIAALIVAALVGGCVGLPLDDPGGTEPAATETTRPANSSGPGQSLEGRYDYDTMDQYVDAILPMITQWTNQTWGNRLPKPGVTYVPNGATGPEDCQDSRGRAATYSGDSYEYCGAGETIYVGQDMLFEFYDRTGDAGPAVGLAHEYGHHIQQRMGVPSPRTPEQSIRHENQADCIAGAWVQYTDQQGWLEYPDDLEDIDALFPLIGSAEGPDRDHGTAEQRRQSFQRGLDDGVKACSSFYPAAPLV